MLITPNINESKQSFVNRYVKQLTKIISVKNSVALAFRKWYLYNIKDPELDPTKYDDEKLIKGIYSGAINPLFLPNDLYSFHYLNLMGGVGFGIGLPSEFEIGTGFYKSTLAYKKNLESFSGVKTFHQTQDLSKQVFDTEGLKRPFKEFKDIATRINLDYNINWLKTEQNAAFRVAQSAEQWQNTQDQKEVFPMLKYVTVGDERVRHTHAAYDGIIKPVNSSFWDTRMPINDWGCRCIVVQLRSGKETNLKKHLSGYNLKADKKNQVKTLKNHSKTFANNAGKSGVIFPKTGHPYYKIPSEFKRAQNNNFEFTTPSDKEVKKTMRKIK